MIKRILSVIVLALTLNSGAQTPISTLPVATVANSGDVTVLVQAGQTKQLATSNLVSSIIPSINSTVTNTIQALILAGANITITTNASGQLTLLVSGLGTAAFSNSVSFMASTNQTGIRRVLVNEAGMAFLTPLNANEWVINNDNMVHRATGALVGNWDNYTSQTAFPGNFIAGGLYGSSLYHEFRSQGIVDYSTVIAYGSNSFDGFGWGDNSRFVFPHQEATFAIDGHNSKSPYYQGNNYLQFNPRYNAGTGNNNSVTNPASYGVSFVTFENGGNGQYIWNWAFYNGTNGDQIYYAAKAVNANSLTMHDGKEALHIDGTNGIIGLHSSGPQGVTGQGQISWTSAGVISGSNTTFLTSCAIGDQLFVGGAGVTLISITSQTNALAFEVQASQSYGNYSIQHATTVFGNINPTNTTSNVTFTASSGALFVGGRDLKDGFPSINLFNQDSRWQFIALPASLNLRGPRFNASPIQVDTNAPNIALWIDGTSNIVASSAIRVGGLVTSPVWTSGTGSPEGKIIGPIGSLYSRTDGGALTSFYVKETGTGNTGWVGK